MMKQNSGKIFAWGGAVATCLFLGAGAMAGSEQVAPLPAISEHAPADTLEQLPVAPVTDDPSEPVLSVTNTPTATNASVVVEGEQGASPVVDEHEAAYDSMQLMAEVIMHIRKHYVKAKTFQEIAYGALHGMLQGMDPHSDFLEPKAYEGLKEDTRASFSGIGIHIGMRNGVLIVIAPIEDTPAFRAGLIAGDRIIEIDGEPTDGWSLRDAVVALRGSKGSAVKLKIVREGAEDPLTISIIRDDIEVSTIKGTRMVSNRVGYIRITQFAEPTAAMLQDALETLLDAGMEALVLDLRSNPGGLLRSAVAVAEKFVAEDDIVVSTRGREGAGQTNILRASGVLHYTDLDMAVLINRGSASASEIVAGCLQDYGRAVLVGEQSFGKGSVQSVITLASNTNAAIRLTTAYYYTPQDRMIHNKGIRPDIEVKLSPREWRRVVIKRAQTENPDAYLPDDVAGALDDLEDVVDRPLQRAVDMLQAVLILNDKR